MTMCGPEGDAFLTHVTCPVLFLINDLDVLLFANEIICIFADWRYGKLRETWPSSHQSAK